MHKKKSKEQPKSSVFSHLHALHVLHLCGLKTSLSPLSYSIAAGNCVTGSLKENGKASHSVLFFVLKNAYNIVYMEYKKVRAQKSNWNHDMPSNTRSTRSESEITGSSTPCVSLSMCEVLRRNLGMIKSFFEDIITCCDIY